MAKTAILRPGSVVDGTPPSGSTAGAYALGDQVVWTAVPTLQNSWANVASFQAAEYRRDFQGVVHLRGTLDTGTKAATTLITTLPAGSRPAAAVIVNVVSDVAAGVATTLRIATTGAITVGTVALTAACQITLNGISFDTA